MKDCVVNLVDRPAFSCGTLLLEDKFAPTRPGEHEKTQAASGVGQGRDEQVDVSVQAEEIARLQAIKRDKIDRQARPGTPW